FALRLLPHTPAVPLACVAAVAACGLLRLVAARLPLDVLTGAPPRACPGYGIGSVVNVLGVVALLTLPLPPVLGALPAQVARGGAARVRAPVVRSPRPRRRARRLRDHPRDPPA